MNKKLLNKKDHSPACEYCEKGRLSPAEDSVLCIKKGVVSLDFKCRSYKYDPLKRKPKAEPVLHKSDPADFEL